MPHVYLKMGIRVLAKFQFRKNSIGFSLELGAWPWCLYSVPEALTKEVHLVALEADAVALEYVPEEIKEELGW